MRLLPLVLLLSACGAVSLNLGSGKDDEANDSGLFDGDGSDVDDDEDEGCDEITISHTGDDDEPVVGESWHVFLKCDGATLTGPSVITFDPLDFASIDINYITFLMAGTGSMKLQVGGYWENMEINVAKE